MTRKKEKKLKNRIIKQSFFCLTTVFLIILLNIIVFKNKIFSSQIDEITTSYVSLYNQTPTDILRIINIEKMSDKKGKSNKNEKNIDLSITSEKNMQHEIVLYEVQNDIPDKYIKIEVTSDKQSKINTLDQLEKIEDGGKIIYFSDNNKEKIKIKMWVSEKYKEKINDTSFEVRIRKR